MKLLDFLLEQDAHGGEPASIERAAWAQFGHSLTQRLYERCFQTSKDEDYAVSWPWIGHRMISPR
jgi:hypothetical protein